MTEGTKVHPGSALHEDRVARFAVLAKENPALAYEEYGLSLVHSINEADAARYLERVGYEDASPDGVFLRAVAAHREGDLEVAKAAYEAFRKEHPDRIEVLYNLAVLEYQRGNEEAAAALLDDFAKVLAARPASPAKRRALALANALRDALAAGAPAPDDGEES